MSTNKYHKILTILALIAFGAIATSASAMIGQTPDQVILDARRDKDTLSIKAEPFGNRSALQVDYRDGATINHVFGTNGREIAFFLTARKRLTNEEVFAMQRMYHTSWGGTGIDNGISSYESQSNLYMGVTRGETFDLVSILDQSRMGEIQSAILASTTPAPALPAVAPADVSPSTEENDCLIKATKKYAELKPTGCWVRIFGFRWSGKGKTLVGHAAVFYQPTSSSDVYYWDKDLGSLGLHTQSHDLEQLSAALNQLLRNTNIRITSPKWIDSDGSKKEFADAADKSNGQPIWYQTSTEQTVKLITSLVLAILILAGYAWVIVICFLKGKNGLAVLGIFGSFVPFLSWVPIIGSIRIAKPTSWWARKKYGPEKMNIAHQRFTPV